MAERALFLDRDGVINEDREYIYRSQDIAFVDGIFELASAAKAAGYRIIVVTNQSGIGRGYYTEADFQTLMDWMGDCFAEHDAGLDAVYFSPYHPEKGLGAYKRESPCRKPAPGMILQAAQEHGIDLGASLLVGDSPRDIQAGRAAGVGRLVFFDATGAKADLVEHDAVRVRRLVDIIPLLRK